MSELGVGVIGFGWMGRVHAQAYTRVRHHFPDIAPVPRLVAIADEVPGRAEAAAVQFGATTSTRDWRELLTDPTIGAISVTAPNFLHREIGAAVVEAGKHLWIEKPVGLGLSEATAVRDAAAKAGVQSAVGFNYRNAPAVQYARELIANGEIGEVTNARFRFLSDYAAHPEGALTWRYLTAQGGSGVLGDLASHGIDLVNHLLGDVDALVADTAVFVRQRAKPTGATTGHARVTGGELGTVENDDWVGAQLRLASGARVAVEASRVSVGDQNNYGFEIHGTTGYLAWDFRRLGELVTSLGSSFQDQPSTTLYVGPGHGDYAAFQPGSANSMGFDDLKVIELRNFLTSIATGRPVGATLDDAVRSAQALDAMVESVERGAWVTL
jgi:predicted dehydrogenase